MTAIEHQQTGKLSFSIDRILDKSSSLDKMVKRAERYDSTKTQGIYPHQLMEKCHDIPNISDKLRIFYNNRSFYTSIYPTGNQLNSQDCHCNSTAKTQEGNHETNSPLQGKRLDAASFKENMGITISDEGKLSCTF